MEIIDLEPGKIYQLKYKLAGQRLERYAQLSYLGSEPASGRRRGPKTFWSGRPTIGTLSFNPGEIREVKPIASGTPKVTWFDKPRPVT